jgi:ATP-dependent DNA helicase RecG
MNDAELLELIKEPESERIERTRDATSSKFFKKASEAVCAFANDMSGSDKPGILFIGLEDDGTPSGIKVDDDLLKSIGNQLVSSGQIIPTPHIELRKLNYQESDVLAVVVQPSDAPPVRYDGRVCIRIGPQQHYATPEQERRLSERRIDRSKTWDMRPALDASLDDLSLDLFKINYLPQAIDRETLRENGRTLEEQLAALRFYDLRKNVPTNAGILVFGKDPLGFYPGSYVQYVKYAGKTKGADVLEERRFSGDLGTVLKNLDQLARDQSKTRPERQANLSDKTIYDYPPVALHEVYMNAIIHRNYEASTSPVAIDQYEDRIEVLNPGGLFGDLTQDLFQRATSYRNPVLAEAAKLLGFVNRFGRGISIVNQNLKDNASPPAEFNIQPNHFLVTLRVRS